MMWILLFTFFSIQFSQLVYTQGNNGTEVPQDCSGHQIYDDDIKMCVRNCQGVANSQQTYDDTNLDACKCDIEFIWNSTSTLCVRDCQGVLNSNKQASSLNPTQCQCNGGWTWNSVQKDCSTSVCQSPQIWIDSVSACGRDCSNADNSQKKTNLLTLDECICNTGYLWNINTKQCVIDCSVQVNASQCQQVNCSKECLRCSSTGCLACENGYALLSNGTCIKCMRGCSGTCDPNNITVCLSCTTGYYLENQKCVKCPTGCQNCTSGTECISCYLGYDLLSLSNGNQICTIKCNYPCQTCNTSKFCITCVSGYVRQGTTCVINTTCTPPACTVCPTGTFGNPGSCTACNTSCRACSSASSCSSCVDGYFLNGNSCPTCPTQCKTCSNAQYCSICADGYVAQVQSNEGLTCIPCSSNCLTCVQKTTKCETCRAGYRNLNSRCYNSYNVGCQFEFDHDFNDFIKTSYLSNFINIFTRFFKKQPKNFILNSLTQGSAIVNGSLEAQSSTQALSLTSEIAAAVNGNSSIFETPIISSSFVALFDDEPIDTTSSSLDQNINVVAIVLGVIIPVVIVFIVASVLVWIKKSKVGSELKNDMMMEKYGENVNQSQPPLIRNPNIL